MSEQQPQQRPRGPGMVYSATSLVMLVALIALAFSPSNQTPPSIAEFAPQPREQITEAPDSQTSEFGSGEGGETIIEYVGTGEEAPPPPPPPPATVVEEVIVPAEARVRRCVGDPPRQIEDPQSPPCVAFWDGEDNGGATWLGVTADTITIAVPHVEAGPATGEDDLTREVEALEAFFNERFEFYGRRLNLVKADGASPNVSEPDPDTQKSVAVQVAQEIQAFASLPYADMGDADHYYYDELTRFGIVSVFSSWGSRRSQAELEALHPYQWGVIPSAHEISADQGDWSCVNLVGKPVQWSGQFNGQPRKFGILISPSPDGSVPDIEPLRKRLAECGAGEVVEVQAPFGQENQASRTAVLTLQTEGVTTVMPFTAVATLFLGVYHAADEQQYQPEWVVNSYSSMAEDTGPLFAPNSPQFAHSFGLRYQNKMHLVPDRFANWGVNEGDPGAADLSTANIKYIYEPLLLLASGIQWAGPNLTPDTFGAALRNLAFPNPGAGTLPYYQAHVGFGPGDHFFFDDAAPIFWRDDETSHDLNTPTGAYCYVDGGSRYLSGNFPTTPSAIFHDGPCY